MAKRGAYCSLPTASGSPFSGRGGRPSAIKKGTITAEDAAAAGYVKGAKKRKSGLKFPYYNADTEDNKKALMLVPQKQPFLEGALDTEFKEKRTSLNERS